MSITITVDLFCDACSCWVHGDCAGDTRSAQAEIAPMRKYYRTKGWITKRLNGRLIDICPDCQKAGRRVDQ